MSITTRTLERRFSYLGLQLPDPDPKLTPEQVRDLYSATYPELTTAAIEGPEATGGTLQYKLTRAIGTKG
jgi:PRTRC genetic system protein C